MRRDLDPVARREPLLRQSAYVRSGIGSKEGNLTANTGERSADSLHPLTLVSSLFTAVLSYDLLPALGAFAVYLRTLAPSVYGFDSAELATGAFSLGIVHPTGYPLYLLIAKLFAYLPERNVAYRVNLLSSVMAVSTIWLAIRLARRLGARQWAAWFGAGLLAFSYGFWSMSIVAEVYTLHTALVAATLLLLDRTLEALDQGSAGADRWLVGLAFVYGLSLTNHVSSVLLAPAIALPLVRRLGPKDWVRRLPVLALAFTIGLAPYLYLPVRYAANTELNYIRTYYQIDLTTLKGLWWMVSGQAYRFFAFGYSGTGYLHELLGLALDLWRNLTGLGAVLGAIGLARLAHSRQRLAPALLLGFATTFVFFAGYAVADKSSMLLAAWMIWSLSAAVGAGWVVGRLASWLQSQDHLATKMIPAALRVVLMAGVPIILVANFRWLDLSQAYGAEHYAKQVLHSVPQNAVVMGPWSSAVILEYFQQVEGMRPDVQVFNRSRFEVAEYYKHWKAGTPYPIAVEFIERSVSNYVDQALKIGAVYDLEYEPRLAATFEYQPVGRLFQLTPKDPS